MTQVFFYASNEAVRILFTFNNDFLKLIVRHDYNQFDT